MNVTVVVAPGFKKKTGYYFRALRDTEALNNIGYNVSILGLDSKGIFDAEGTQVNFSRAHKILKNSELIIFENIAVSALGIFFPSKRRTIVVHGSLDDLDEFRYAKIKKILYRLILKISLNRFNSAITVSEKMNQYLLDIDECSVDKLLTIPNLPNDSFLNNILEASKNKNGIKNVLGLNKNKKHICYCGNAQGWQKIDYLLSLFLKICDMSEDIDLIILTGDQKAFIDKVEELGIDNSRIIIKTVNNDLVPKYLIASDCLYLIRDENNINKVACPTKAIEYLASGTPIIVSEQLGDISELINNSGNGIVFSKVELHDYQYVGAKLIDYLSTCSGAGVDIEHVNKFRLSSYEEIYRKL